MFSLQLSLHCLLEWGWGGMYGKDEGCVGEKGGGNGSMKCLPTTPHLSSNCIVCPQLYTYTARTIDCNCNNNNHNNNVRKFVSIRFCLLHSVFAYIVFLFSLLPHSCFYTFSLHDTFRFTCGCNFTKTSNCNIMLCERETLYVCVCVCLWNV